MTTKHKADGLYYVTYDMLREAGACHVAELVRNEFKAGDYTKIPITKHNVAWLYNSYGGLYWAALRMLEKGKVTDDEHTKFDYSDNNIAQAFMDMLLSRAKREGLVK